MENKLINQLRKDDPQLYSKYCEDGIIKDSQDKVVSLPPALKTFFVRKVGMCATERLSVDDYHLLKATQLLLSQVTITKGKNWIIRKYAEKGLNFNDTKEKMNIYSKRLHSLKMIYDTIEDKSFKSKIKGGDVEANISDIFITKLRRLPLYLPELYNLFVFLINYTDVKTMSIPNDALQTNEHRGIHKIDKRNTGMSEVKNASNN